MPGVMYKSGDGQKKKMFPYTKSGVASAKQFAKASGGKLDMSMNNSAKAKMKKKYGSYTISKSPRGVERGWQKTF